MAGNVARIGHPPEIPAAGPLNELQSRPGGYSQETDMVFGGDQGIRMPDLVDIHHAAGEDDEIHQNEADTDQFEYGYQVGVHVATRNWPERAGRDRTRAPAR